MPSEHLTPQALQDYVNTLNLPNEKRDIYDARKCKWLTQNIREDNPNVTPDIVLQIHDQYLALLAKS